MSDQKLTWSDILSDHFKNHTVHYCLYNYITRWALNEMSQINKIRTVSLVEEDLASFTVPSSMGGFDGFNISKQLPDFSGKGLRSLFLIAVDPLK